MAPSLAPFGRGTRFWPNGPCLDLEVKTLEHLQVYDPSLPVGERMTGKTAVMVNRPVGSTGMWGEMEGQQKQSGLSELSRFSSRFLDIYGDIYGAYMDVFSSFIPPHFHRRRPKRCTRGGLAAAHTARLTSPRSLGPGPRWWDDPWRPCWRAGSQGVDGWGVDGWPTKQGWPTRWGWPTWWMAWCRVCGENAS